MNYTDEYGDWFKKGNVLVHLNPTQKWIDENPPEPEVPQSPSETDMLMDYVIDVDYRVTMIELGL
ncbi:hypothetical protein [Psychrobacillus sp.]|uniref:hypothetical protein n=1 Tax=Psychrobacillus sp. TaxID=1871623 RepID=UPI0028BD7B1A|nr:hypothetical protein [Psychrobacillus sp.]